MGKGSPSAGRVRQPTIRALKPATFLCISFVFPLYFLCIPFVSPLHFATFSTFRHQWVQGPEPQLSASQPSLLISREKVWGLDYGLGRGGFKNDASGVPGNAEWGQTARRSAVN